MHEVGPHCIEDRADAGLHLEIADVQRVKERRAVPAFGAEGPVKIGDRQGMDADPVEFVNGRLFLRRGRDHRHPAAAGGERLGEELHRAFRASQDARRVERIDDQNPSGSTTHRTVNSAYSSSSPSRVSLSA